MPGICEAQPKLLALARAVPAATRSAQQGGVIVEDVASDESQAGPDPEQLRRILEAGAGPAARKYVGLAVGAVAGGGQAVVGWGRARDLAAGGFAHSVAPNDRTIFQIGSVTKVFTCLLFADAIRRGEVALEQPVASIIPRFGSRADSRAVTLMDLATHRSGLARLPPGIAWWKPRTWSNPYVDFTREKLLEAVQRPAKRLPGSFRYSNYGVGILGEALARAAGARFEDLMRDRICLPLGLVDTTIHIEPAQRPRVAEGHSKRGTPVEAWRFPGIPAAGALHSTVADLLMLVRAHLDPDSTPLASALRFVTEECRSAEGEPETAFGWHRMQSKGGRAWLLHNGGTGGFFSLVAFDPRARVGVVVLTNSARPVDGVGLGLLKRLAPGGD